jgi:RNA polymerase sigma-70 factor, ECF subfamily
VRGSIWQDIDPQLRGLVERCAQQDHDAFAALYDQTSSRVHALVSRIVGNPADAEEVTLDVYLQVWREASRFDAGRGSVGAWLLIIARSRALDRVRSHESRQKRESAPIDFEHPSTQPSPEDLSSMSEDRRTVAEAIAALPVEHRQVIELAYFGGLSHSEMAECLDLPLGTVKTRVRLGMTRLRDFIGEGRA